MHVHKMRRGRETLYMRATGFLSRPTAAMRAHAAGGAQNGGAKIARGRADADTEAYYACVGTGEHLCT